MSISQQAVVLAHMMLCGAAVGLMHDLLALVRCGQVMTAAADLLLAPVGAISVIVAALALRCEAFRLYVFLGFAAGWAIYSFSLGTIVRFLMKGFTKMSKKVTK